MRATHFAKIVVRCLGVVCILGAFAPPAFAHKPELAATPIGDDAHASQPQDAGMGAEAASAKAPADAADTQDDEKQDDEKQEVDKEALRKKFQEQLRHRRR